jgi:glutathione S-transferase
MALVLHGYRFSVYLRIARIVLAEKSLSYERVEVNPFATDVPKSYLDLHPFNRVPTLVHGDFALYETNAITRYVDEAFAGPPLQPASPRDRARMTQIVSIVDSYGYVPMVRQVFGQRVFGPATGRAPDETAIAKGLESSRRVLGALERLIARDGPIAGGEPWSLADFHLAPMMAYFTTAPEGRDALAGHKRLSAWWSAISRRKSVIETEPGLPERGDS